MDEFAPPVVTAKPVRGREIQTTVVPTDIFDAMRVEDLKPELEKPRQGQAEYYHEGYVDGKLYLVPDSNLEAMKDIINFKMRPRRSTRYKHQTSYEISDYDQFKGKLSGLLGKIGNFSDSASTIPEEEPNEGESSEVSAEEIYETTEEETDGTISEMSKATSITAISEVSTATSKTTISKETRPESVLVPLKRSKSDVYRVRFILSGHIRKNKNHIYIVQKYDGKNNVFGNQKADFFSNKSYGNIDINMSGKFFKESILEETQGKPTALNIKPEKIIIDERKSEIYDKHFQSVFHKGSLDLILKGEFIHIKSTGQSTPFITFHIKQNEATTNREPKNEYESTYSRNNDATVLVFEPEKRSPFYRKKRLVGSSSDTNHGRTEHMNKSLNSKSLTKTSQDYHVLKPLSFLNTKKDDDTKKSQEKDSALKIENNGVIECANDACGKTGINV